MRKLYGFIRGLIPNNFKGYLTALLYGLAIKPTVNKRINSPFTKGIVVLSADFEMAWAFRYSKTKSARAEEIGLQERENVPILLSLFEKYNIPVTWATVGHLFLDSCRKEPGSLPHAEMPRPSFFQNVNWSFSSGDWYQHDPCTDYKTSPAWYAPDLIDQIINSGAGHEIGCHTFSHIDCTDRNSSPELLRAEIEACMRLAEKKGIRLKSMVFPGGTHGNYALLEKLGFTCYRKTMKYHVDLPVKDNNGLVKIPSSYTLDKSGYNWPDRRYQSIGKSFVTAASKSKMVAHLWFHPSMDKNYLEKVLPDILKYIDRLRSEGKIEVMTMSQLAALVTQKY